MKFATLAYTLVFTLQTTARFEDDTRMQAGRWIDESIPQGSDLMVCGWDRYVGLPSDESRFALRRRDEKVFWPENRRAKSAYIEISSLQYDRHYRHANLRYSEQYDKLRDPDGLHRLAARFETSFINRDFYGRLDPMFKGYFISPTIEIYAPKIATAN
jgi:hypothetical protein